MELRWRVKAACGLLSPQEMLDSAFLDDFDWDDDGEYQVYTWAKIGDDVVVARSDNPPGDSLVIRSQLIAWNDYWTDEERQLLKPFALLDLSDKGKYVEYKRACRIVDETIRVFLPTAWALSENEHIKALSIGFAECKPVIDQQSALGALRALDALRTLGAPDALDALRTPDALDALDALGALRTLDALRALRTLDALRAQEARAKIIAGQIALMYEVIAMGDE